jgi:hypothetical protein
MGCVKASLKPIRYTWPLFDAHNWTLGPDSAAINRILISVMEGLPNFWAREFLIHPSIFILCLETGGRGLQLSTITRYPRHRRPPPVTAMRIFWMAAKQGPNILLFMSSRTRQTIFVSVVALSAGPACFQDRLASGAQGPPRSHITVGIEHRWRNLVRGRLHESIEAESLLAAVAGIAHTGLQLTKVPLFSSRRPKPSSHPLPCPNGD